MAKNLRKILINRLGARVMVIRIWTICELCLAQVWGSRPQLVTEPINCTDFG